jgi:hypothetical protein
VRQHLLQQEVGALHVVAAVLRVLTQIRPREVGEALAERMHDLGALLHRSLVGVELEQLLQRAAHVHAVHRTRHADSVSNHTFGRWLK